MLELQDRVQGERQEVLAFLVSAVEYAALLDGQQSRDNGANKAGFDSNARATAQEARTLPGSDRPAQPSPVSAPGGELPSAPTRQIDGLPPRSVCMRESHCTPGAVNPTGCGGRGCFTQWQFDPNTWAGVARAHPELGLPAHPRDATPEQEDVAAAALWDGGRGCAHWSACR